MMIRFIKQILFLITVFISLNAYAQDPHFSQYFNTPLFVNPANAGNGIEYMRATLIYRNQWAGVANPYVTEGFMVDKTVNRLGFGFLVVKNSAGSASLKQLNLSGSLSYNQPLGDDNQVSGALQIGMLHKSFDPNQMTFDSQFIEDTGFDPALSSGEIFTYTSITRPDVSIGFMWQRGFANKRINFKPFGGISFSHINKPSESFITSENKLPIKSTFNFGAGILLKDNLELRPSVLYVHQDHFHEFNIGAVAGFTMENNNKFQVGLYDRSNDAVILYAGYQVDQIFIGTSYDINVSGLKQASNGTGAFEITLSYIPKAKKKAPAPQPKKAVVQNSRKKVQKVEKKTLVPHIESTITLPEKLAVVQLHPVGEKQPVIEKPKEQANITTVIPPAETKAVAVNKSIPVDSKEIKPVEEKKAVAVVEPKTITETPVVKSETVAKPVEEKKAVAVVEPKTITETPVVKSETNVKPVEEKKAVAVVEPKTIAETPVVKSETNVKPVEEKKAVAVVESKTITETPVVKSETVTQSVEETKIVAEVSSVVAPVIISTPAKESKPEIKTETTVKKPAENIAVLPKSHVVMIDLKNNTATPEIKSEPSTKVVDTDGDGIPDKEDHCPFIKGGKLTQGCPDSDGDGIQDMMDECPMEPGTAKNFGCPEKIPSVENAVLIKQFNNIEFQTGGSKVKTADIYDVIEYAIDLLYQYPNSHVILSGHTDSEGNDLFNMHLSEKRNMVVKNYMMKKGIAENRIQIINYGETMPLKDNTTTSGRAKNRRVEVNILKNINK